MNGVTIGDVAIIAAGSVVTSNVLLYSKVDGVPVKHIRFRFTEYLIHNLSYIVLGLFISNHDQVKFLFIFNIDGFILKYFII